MSSEEIKKKFIDYFSGRGHTHIPAAPLIPVDDSSVLFTTAGMQQFKRYYAFPDEAPSSRIVTIQPCIRTSDIDEVGDDTHLIFFEMLGNFSFGYPNSGHSYFKKEAIALAWEFLTGVLKVDKKRLSATYFDQSKARSTIATIVETDLESLEILKKLAGLNQDQITPQGDDNFWTLGLVGSPGGPTVEFYVDGLEVWNLVFNEYTFRNRKYIPSKFKGVDTGMGLERLASIINNQSNIFETDLFGLIINKIEEVSGKKYQQNKKEFRIIADHLRTSVFLTQGGVLPSNVDSGYVNRRLIRRAVKYCSFLGIERIFEILPSIYQVYGINQDRDYISTQITNEELKFKKTLEKGLKVFDSFYQSYLAKHKRNSNGNIFSVVGGKFAFNMFQTYGFPLEMTIEELKSRKMLFIESAIRKDFVKELSTHQEKSRVTSLSKFKGGLASGGEAETKYHTATHLLLATLRELLDPEIYQKGSNITAERLRFDFNYPQKLTSEQIHQIEALVNQKISENLPVTITEMPKKEALKTVKVSFDPSKYGDSIKVYTIGNFSSELCGGPHVGSTGVLGRFKIVKEESSSAGVRRIKAVIQ